MSFVEPIGFKLNSRVKAVINRMEEYPFHMHEDIVEVICVLKGKFYISESAQDYVLYPKDVYIFNPKDPHKINNYDSDAVLLTIQIDQTHYARIFGMDFFPYFICNSFVQDDQYSIDTRYLRFLIARIFVEYSKAEPSEHLTEEYTRELLEYLLDQHRDYLFVKTGSDQIKMLRRPDVGGEGKDLKRIYEIIDYIYENFTKTLYLEEIAKKEFLSKGYLSRYIKKESGLTFSEHLSLARCEEVERLLGNTKKTIDQIAMDVGFANRSHLATQFKKWFKKTPTEYRKNIGTDLSKFATINCRPVEFKEVESIINQYLDGG